MGYIIAAISSLALLALSSAAHADIPKFGSTCIPVTSGASKNVCVSSNGTTMASKYKFRNSVPTTGKHTGCKARGETIFCSGGSYATSQGSGGMPGFSVKLKGGKPISASWN